MGDDRIFVRSGRDLVWLLMLDGVSLFWRQSSSSDGESLMTNVWLFGGHGVFVVSNNSTVRMCDCGGCDNIVFSGQAFGKSLTTAMG